MEQLIDRIIKAPPAAKYGGMAALVVGLCVANFFLLVQPEEERLERLRSQQSTLNQQLAEKQEIAQNLNDKRKEMDALEQQLAEALIELPESKDIDELLAQLNDKGKKSGLEISKVEPGSEVNASFFSKIPIKMSVTGNYHEIAMFLQEVATMKRIVNVNNIKLSSPNSKSDKIILTSEFLATTFRFLDQSKVQKDKKK